MSGSKLHLAEEPEEVLKGLRAWRNPSNGVISALLHFDADPEGPGEEARRRGMDDDSYKREHALDFSTFAGKPVYPGFNNSDPDVFYNPDLPIYRGWDFGYHRPAVIFVQIHGGIWALGEVMGEDETLENFIVTKAKPYGEALFGEKAKYWDAADIAGRQVSDKSNFTSFTLLANHGIFPVASKTEIDQGLTIIRKKLADDSIRVHPRCTTLVEGFKGGYHYPPPTVHNPDPKLPAKDGFYEHLQDAFRYVIVNNVWLYPRKEEPKPEPEPPFVERVLAAQRRGWSDPDFGDY